VGLMTRRALFTGALALLLAPPELAPHRKVWALGGFEPARWDSFVMTTRIVIESTMPGAHSNRSTWAVLAPAVSLDMIKPGDWLRWRGKDPAPVEGRVIEVQHVPGVEPYTISIYDAG
jgi:hypothetical protein